MKLLKTVFFLTFFGLISHVSFAQIYQYKTSALSYIEKNEKGVWGKWSDFADAELLITIDPTKAKIVINSPEIQVFTIITFGDKIETDTNKIIPFDCIDLNSSKCKIFLITRKDENNRKQLYINYNEVKFVYNIYD